MFRTLVDWLSPRQKAVVVGVIALVAYGTAINQARALPWAFAALVLATLISGIVWPRVLTRRLSVIRRGPTRAEEGDTICFRVEIQNQGWLPCFMIEVLDRLPFVGAAHQAPNNQEKVLGVLAYVPGGKTTHFELKLLCEKRGYYRLGPMSLVSGFPLGLAQARCADGVGVQELTIYPDVFPILSLPLRGAPSQIHRGGYLLPEGAGSAEFSGIREYRRGDSPRHIHWPTTARLNELMVREFEPLASACLCITLDSSTRSNVGQGKQSTLEYAVRIAASVARYGCTQNIRTRLVAEAARISLIPSGSGLHHYQAILDELAIVDADGTTEYAEVLQRVALNCIRGETVLVFLSAPAAQSSAILQALALLKARHAHLFAVVFEQDTFSNTTTDGVPDALLGGLLELGAHCQTVRQGDDLLSVFNQ
jgi:uncharacterized protein (DUF58 family)